MGGPSLSVDGPCPVSGPVLDPVGDPVGGLVSLWSGPFGLWSGRNTSCSILHTMAGFKCLDIGRASGLSLAADSGCCGGAALLLQCCSVVAVVLR